LKVSLAPRLFAAVLAAMLAVGAMGLGLVRWQVLAGPVVDPEQAERFERERLRVLGEDLAVAFRRHHDWSFLPQASADRKAWLRARVLALPVDARDALRLAPNFGDRIGLLDADGDPLAGVVASRLAIAFASIDTIRVPVVVDGATVGNLVVARADDAADELAIAFLVQRQAQLLAIVGVAVLLSALAAALLAARFRRPIRRLVVGARRLEAGVFDVPVEVERSDELGELARAFDHLAARLADAERTRRQWVADTSHELRTPLSVLRAQLEAMQDGVRGGGPDDIALLLRQVGSLGRRVDDLYVLAHADAGQLHVGHAPVDAWALVVEAMQAFADKFRARGIATSLGPAPLPASVPGDAERLRQVLANLLENAVRYTDEGGRIEVRGDVVGEALDIVIDDSAPTVPDAEIPRLGERFFRGEAARAAATGGAGLGLALCRRIVEAHGGRLDFAASPLGGLRVRLRLPLESSA
jgi:two-component system sensor histidine kinase BaeS